MARQVAILSPQSAMRFEMTALYTGRNWHELGMRSCGINCVAKETRLTKFSAATKVATSMSLAFSRMSRSQSAGVDFRVGFVALNMREASTSPWDSCC